MFELIDDNPAKVDIAKNWFSLLTADSHKIDMARAGKATVAQAFAFSWVSHRAYIGLLRGLFQWGNWVDLRINSGLEGIGPEGPPTIGFGFGGEPDRA